MLVAFAGLPGTGKTTLAREIARQRQAFYIRVDTIEQSLRAGTVTDEIGPEGYAVALALAQDNLAVGQLVAVDAVNPVPAARSAWRDLAAKAATTLLEIEVVCSDRDEHRRRVDQAVAAVCARLDSLRSPRARGLKPRH
jgi:predicted kinase